MLERFLDPLDAIMRSVRASKTEKARVQGTIGHREAAEKMQALTTRDKGGWLR